jgi:hypothetical protein
VATVPSRPNWTPPPTITIKKLTSNYKIFYVYGMHPIVYLFKQYLFYQLVSLQNYFFIIKRNKHYSVNICFICLCCYNATCFDPLLGHPQAYAIQALVTASNMNSYCIYAWVLIYYFILM